MTRYEYILMTSKWHLTFQFHLVQFNSSYFYGVCQNQNISHSLGILQNPRPCPKSKLPLNRKKLEQDQAHTYEALS